MFFLHNNCHILQYITIHYKLKGIRHLITYLTASYFPLSVQYKKHHIVPFNNLKFKPLIRGSLVWKISNTILLTLNERRL